MADRDDGKSDRKAYRVGKNRPPREHQFPTGKSGNPRGRPRKKKLVNALLESIDPFAATVLSHGGGKIPKRVPDGRVEKVARFDAALDSLFRQALKGGVRAAEHYLNLISEATNANREFQEELYLIAKDYRDRWLAKFTNAERAGRPLPNIYPDPRDVIIHRDMTVAIVGPMDEEEHELMLGALKLRDIALSLIDMTDDVAPDQRNNHLAIAHERIEHFNWMLPPRLRHYPAA